MTTLQRRRTDALPEHAVYRDDGCSVAPSCLACPLPRCRYDNGSAGARGMLNETRDQQIRAQHAAGASVPTIAAAFHVSRRTVFRVLEDRS